ncbi:polysaccharide biosynthesis tyrosine autokinase [Jatrophihabitans telluris]|uniref:non-specific protein-tyrosine kinase n=1 Tax=Jatrophihabitans telluris TaxID=2038343 RepID=A0ABY4R0E1_9ACTN|nr:polysaccharide biosynthesis tyrosine autokinase [Jatrophihabitans telluris]UQX89366.1 polysaccharide biosynthesis tyrosine autokinase [Jatrophihabitans telluris]
MSTSKFLTILRQRWPIVVLCVILGAGLSAADIARSTKVYSAGVEIFVATSGAGDVNQLNSANTFIQARVQSYVNVSTSPAVTGPVRKKLNLALTDSELASKISASAPLNKVLIDIHVHDASPARAALIANAVGEQFIGAVQDIESVTSSTSSKVTTQSPVKLTVIHPAQTPQAPIAPRKKVILGLGLLAGLLVGVGYVVARERLDTRLRSTTDVEDLSGLPVLGVVPIDRAANSQPIAFRADGYSRRGEAFRQLRTNLQFVGVDSPPRIISVTSASSADGKTSVAINLAASLSEAGKTVCLIETDLRRPTIGKILGLPSTAGLTSVLVGNADLDDVLQDLGSGFFVVTSGALPPNPSELLASNHFASLINEVAERFDYVICDSAPLLPVADGSEVASSMQATLLVVRAGKTNQAFLTESVERLSRVGAVIAGIVFNMVQPPRGAQKYEYYRNPEAARVEAGAHEPKSGRREAAEDRPRSGKGGPGSAGVVDVASAQAATTARGDVASPASAAEPRQRAVDVPDSESAAVHDRRADDERRAAERRAAGRPTPDRRGSGRRNERSQSDTDIAVGTAADADATAVQAVVPGVRASDQTDVHERIADVPPTAGPADEITQRNRSAAQTGR